MRHFNESCLKDDSDKELLGFFFFLVCGSAKWSTACQRTQLWINQQQIRSVCVQPWYTVCWLLPPSLCVCVCVCRYAAAVQDGSQYFVLLIITDGVISDMAQTKEAIVNVRTAATTADGVSSFFRFALHLSTLRFYVDSCREILLNRCSNKLPFNPTNFPSFDPHFVQWRCWDSYRKTILQLRDDLFPCKMMAPAKTHRKWLFKGPTWHKAPFSESNNNLSATCQWTPK